MAIFHWCSWCGLRIQTKLIIAPPKNGSVLLPGPETTVKARGLRNEESATCNAREVVSYSQTECDHDNIKATQTNLEDVLVLCAVEDALT